MQAYAVPSSRVPDGTYSYRVVQNYGPALAVTATVHDGFLLVYTLGEGQDAEECPVKWLPEVEAAALKELAWHIAHGLVLKLDEEASVAA